MSGREGQGLNVYRNIGQKIIYWRGQKVLVYDIWPNELPIYSNLRHWELIKTSTFDTLNHYLSEIV